MSQLIDYRYTGQSHQPPPEGTPERTEDGVTKRMYYPYLPSSDLTEVVDLAIALERPLLLEGEPGCGKTRLAHALVYEYTYRYLRTLDEEGKVINGVKDEKGFLRWWPFHIWNVKSRARAQDGLYSFDAIARLRDAQLLGNTSNLDADEVTRLNLWLKDPKKYRKFGPLGEVLRPKDQPEDEWQRNYRPVLLIDEIDKADSDFANDLLRELEEMQFDIPETQELNLSPLAQNEQGKSMLVKPIILITSNQERPLPEAFLRRCLYFFVSFPEEKTGELRKIVQRRFGNRILKKEKLVDEAVKHFYEIRHLLEAQPGSKPPGTSEFIEFLGVLLQKRTVAEARKDLQNLSKRLPLLGTLLKSQADQMIYVEKFK